TVLYSLLVTGPPEQHPLTLLFNESTWPVEWVLVFVLAVGAKPVTEELLFRGVLQPWFSRRPWGGDAAMVGAFVIALLFRGNSLPNVLQERDLPAIVYELSPALFILALVPGYLLIDQLAGRLFPAAGASSVTDPQESLRQGPLAGPTEQPNE